MLRRALLLYMPVVIGLVFWNRTSAAFGQPTNCPDLLRYCPVAEQLYRSPDPIFEYHAVAAQLADLDLDGAIDLLATGYDGSPQ